MPGALGKMGLPVAGPKLVRTAPKAEALLEGNLNDVTPFAYRLIFARHGETAYNAENRLQGQLDIQLNARGRDQARAVGQTLRARFGAEIDRLEASEAYIASPLVRARETMEIARAAMVLPPDRYRLDAALKELSFGAWEGLTWPEIEARDPRGLQERTKDKWRFAPRGGESYAMLARRLRRWLEGLTGDAFVVSHGGVARALMTLIADIPPAKAVDTPITQGRALCFQNGGCHWIV
jgi:broad specificity phosphatase PhoE